MTTPAIAVWYGPIQRFGHLGRPQRWINILGNIAASEPLAANYSINGGKERPLVLGGDLHRLARAGDFNVELCWDEVEKGANQLVIAAATASGRKATTTVELIVEKGRTWPLPYRIDFTKVEDLQAVAQIVDGLWHLEEDGVRTVEPYYDRVLSLGDRTWTNYQASLRLTIHHFTPSQPGPPTYDVTHFGVAMRWRGHHDDGLQPRRKWYPLGAQGEFLLKEDLQNCRWRVLFDKADDKPFEYANGRNPLVLAAPICIKTQVATLPDGRSRYRFKEWQDGRPEPATWDLEGFEVDDYASGSLCLVPHNSAVTIHTVEVEPLLG